MTDGGRCVLVAHDWGGMVAWHTAALYPEVVERLVVMALPHPISWMENMDLDQARAPGVKPLLQRLEHPLRHTLRSSPEPACRECQVPS